MIDLNRFRLPGLEKKFSVGPKNKGFLVLLQTRDKEKGFLDESLEEMSELARAATIRVMGSAKANLPQPSPKYFVREGKLEEVRVEAEKAGANVLIFNVDLSPAQASNIEKYAKIPTIDRTGLILDIFRRRAQSKEGKLQVELAQLNYTLPRLSGLGTVMSRLGGGVGTRGPGEQELERDRRKVRLRIQRVKSELKKVHEHRERLRSGRRKKQFLTTALVGYTNAGKSTLLNALTGARTHVEDKMFATLDPIVRLETVNGHDKMLFIDTVGFLRDLPHSLVESFHATLEEVSESDILIHVLDASSPHAHEFKKTVEKVLRDLKAESKPVILALNKADLLDEDQKRRVKDTWPEGILVSASQQLGLNGILAKIDTVLEQRAEGSL